MLDLALKHGWKPANDADFGFYELNQGNRVTAKDARNLAAALERAYEFLPKQETMLPKLKKNGEPKRGEKITVYDFFSGREARAFVKKCAAFCRKGAFEIW
jgi:hypothetical protein